MKTKRSRSCSSADATSHHLGSSLRHTSRGYDFHFIKFRPADIPVWPAASRERLFRAPRPRLILLHISQCLQARHRLPLWQRSRRRSGRGARSSLSRLALSQTGMSAGRNLMKWKSRRREVPQWLEPSLSDEALAEEEGLDRFVLLIRIRTKTDRLFSFRIIPTKPQICSLPVLFVL